MRASLAITWLFPDAIAVLSADACAGLPSDAGAFLHSCNSGTGLYRSGDTIARMSAAAISGMSADSRRAPLPGFARGRLCYGSPAGLWAGIFSGMSANAGMSYARGRLY
jgi:hypothetical protein